MGFSLSWVAVRGKSADDVLATLGWRRTGGREESPESPVVCGQLRTGWVVIVMNRSMDAFDGTIDLATLSRGAEVVACAVEEHAMVSACSRWADGRRLLEVTHVSPVNPRHLDVTGSPPPELQGFIDAATRAYDDDEEGETDYMFDVPVDVAEHLTGFRHDAGDDALAFDVLERRPGVAR